MDYTNGVGLGIEGSLLGFFKTGMYRKSFVQMQERILHLYKIANVYKNCKSIANVKIRKNLLF